jgi:hypothetical protein
MGFSVKSKGKRFRLRKRFEPLFSDQFTPPISQLVYVSTPFGRVFCERNSIINFLFKRR